MEHVIKGVNKAHDLYVGTYECIGSIAKEVKENIPDPFSCLCPPLTRLTKRSKKIIDHGLVTTLSLADRLTQRFFRRSIAKKTLRDCRPEIKELLQRAKGELIALSNDCSTVFDRTIIFAEIPTEEETQTILDQLYTFQEQSDGSTPLKKIAAADRAYAACIRLKKIHQQLSEKRGEPLSAQDLAAFTGSLTDNILLTTTYSATVENIGEMVGGIVIDEASPIIKEQWNPAIRLGQMVAAYIGKPVGRLMGTLAGLSGVYYLLSKLPLMRFDHLRTKIQAGALLLMLSIEYMQLNPLTHYFEEQMGGMFYDLGFYSIALLFNYIGMLMAGTEESLGSYVRNMTPATLVYNGANFALETMGFNGVMAGVFSFYLSHVAYNFDLYQGLFNGTLVESCVELEQIGALINQHQLRAVRKGLAGIMLPKLTEKIHHFNQEHLNALKAKVIAMDIKMAPIANVLFDKLDEFSQNAVQRSTQAYDLSGNQKQLEGLDQQLALLKDSLPHSDIAFLFRESGDFFQFLQLPHIEALLNRHKQEYLTVIAQSKVASLDQRQGRALAFERSRRELFMALLRHFFGAKSAIISDYFRPIWDGQQGVAIEQVISPELMDFLIKDMAVPQMVIDQLSEIWKFADLFKLDKEVLRKYIEPHIDEKIEQLYPLVPKVSAKDEACSVHIMEIAIRGLMIFSMARVMTGQIDRLATQRLTREEYLTFIRLITDFVFKIRFPKQSTCFEFRRDFTRTIIQSQCNALV